MNFSFGRNSLGLIRRKPMKDYLTYCKSIFGISSFKRVSLQGQATGLGNYMGVFRSDASKDMFSHDRQYVRTAACQGIVACKEK